MDTDAGRQELCRFLNLTGMSCAELLALFSCDISENDDYYDTIACNIALNFPGRLETLLGDLSGDRLRGAICGLGLAEIRSSAELVRKYLKHRDEQVVKEAIVALSRIGVPEDWVLVRPFLGHPSPYVHGAALRFARAMLGLDAKAILVEALHDQSDVVRWIALDELDGLDGLPVEEFIGLAESLLNDPDPDVRDWARYLLELRRE